VSWPALSRSLAVSRHCLCALRSARHLALCGFPPRRYQGHVGAALILGGVDCNGPALYQVYPHGSTDYLPYVTMGSGSVNAMAIFESEYKDGLTQEEAMKLVHKAVLSGIFNDLGSGSNVDLCVITKDGHKLHRGYDCPNPRKFTFPGGFKYSKGTTPILSTSFTPRRSAQVVVGAGMEVDA
jgi:20S proteasome subunit beta 2